MNTEKTKQYGWYSFGYNGTGTLTEIRNKISKQNLTINHIQSAPGVAQAIISASYQDNDIEQPIQFVLKQTTSYRGELTDYYEIELCYSDFMAAPTYGLWRRLDDFLSDALLCWQGDNVTRIIITGGWVGCSWSNNLERTFILRTKIVWGDDTLPNEKPLLFPLSMPAPDAWQLHDVDEPESIAELQYTLYENTHAPYLPKAIKPSGFQGKVPYLMREDGNRYFIFSRVVYDIHPYSDCPYIRSYYIYLDEDIFFTFRNYISTNEVDYVSSYGFRAFPPDKALWANQRSNGLVNPVKQSKDLCWSMQLTYPIWLRVKHAFCDAWINWQGCKNRLTQTSRFTYRGQISDFKWDKPYGGDAELRGGFVAGTAQDLVISHKYNEK